MFDQLFSVPAALKRHRSGPLAEERRAYLRHLSDQGFSSATLQKKARYLLIVADCLRLTRRSGESIRPDEIKRSAARWANRRTRPVRSKDRHGSRDVFRAVATGWLHFLGRLQADADTASPFDGLVSSFSDYMLHERGLSPATVRGRCWFIRKFLDRLGHNNRSLQEITITQIDELLLHLLNAGSYARVTVQTWTSQLRVFFRYAEMRGWCRKGLAAAIFGPPVFSQTSLPVGPSWDDVKRLLATTEANKPTDIRDRAILMLLAVYGLRAGEVRRLRLSDFDWDRETLLVPSGKARRTRPYPLVHPVGDAVLRYLKEVRPRSVHREVFLSLYRPRPLGGVWHIVAHRLRHLGVSLPHYGPHALRHACATHLLTQGLSIKEIGDHLGHRDADTTRIYAKVDLVGLRQVADFEWGGLI